ncbi:hypothetical protein EUGRSUZ_F04266 [Eucalyptus grandis]|uniref:Uncharacterized protein n=2 Tax=Eucalyptus grandis TaxID=71139 RepID=A0ACC3KPA1_EUCGR|nr:hypothetical protein EUGRSUZ_F04266 [Eucalyptus grandis]
MSYLLLVRELTAKRHVALRWSPRSPVRLGQRMPQPAPAHFRTLSFCLAPVYHSHFSFPCPHHHFHS